MSNAHHVTGYPGRRVNCVEEWMERGGVYESSLKGHFLIAMPSLADPNFSHTVSYIAEHTPEGAMGLVINRIHSELSMAAVFEELKLETDPETASLPVFLGGPVHTGQIFVLHGPPFGWQACQQVTPRVALSNSMDLLDSVAQGRGPTSLVIALGCAGWGPGQLESEIMENAWLSCPATESILFDMAVEERWEEATRLLGIDPNRLTDVSGHA